MRIVGYMNLDFYEKGGEVQNVSWKNIHADTVYYWNLVEVGKKSLKNKNCKEYKVTQLSLLK